MKTKLQKIETTSMRNDKKAGDYSGFFLRKFVGFSCYWIRAFSLGPLEALWLLAPHHRKLFGLRLET